MDFTRFKSNLKFYFSVYLKIWQAKMLGAPRSAHRGALPAVDAWAPGIDWPHVPVGRAGGVVDRRQARRRYDLR
jgi:hypothetical protein